MLIFNSSRSLKTPVNNQRYLSNRHAGKVSIDAYREDFCINDQLNNIAYKCFTKSLFENLKINRTSKMNMAEDRYVSAFLFNEAKTVFLINKPFYFYRENKDSITYTDFTNNRIADKVYCEKQVLKFAEL